MADLISASADRLRRLLLDTAREAVASIDGPTVELVVAALQSLLDTLPQALAAVLAAELPAIAARAITEAQGEIQPAREASDSPSPAVEPPPLGDYGPWAANATAALIAVAVAAAETSSTPRDAREAALQALDEGDLVPLAATAAGRTINDSRQSTFEANSDIVESLRYEAIDDAKTTAICNHLDGKVWPLAAKNIPRPPIHPSCRSRLIPVLRQRSAPETLELRFAPSVDSQAGTFRGIASAYGVLDRHGTEFAPGAFASSIAERRADGGAFPLLLHHDPVRVAGAITELMDRPDGLHVEGRFVLDTDAGREAHALARAGALALSVGFTRLSDMPRPGGGRTITAARLSEISVVAIASNPRARILEVRASPAARAAEQRSVHQMDEDKQAAAQESGEDADLKTIASTVEKIDGRLTTIEGRLQKVEEKIGGEARRLDRVEARSSRIGITAPADETRGIERRAFESFLRSGPGRLGADEVRSLRIADDEAAGYLAPPEFVAEIDKQITQFSPVRQVATVRNTSRSEVTTLRRTTPATALWVGEEEDRTEAEIKYGANTYPVHELATYVDVSLQMLEDSAIDVAAEVAAEFAEAFGAAEATAFVTGSGVKRPMGFMSDADILNTVSGAAAAITADGLINIYHAVKAAYRPNSTWGMNSTTMAAVRKLKSGTGEYLVQTAGLAGAPATTLLGRPVIEMPDMPDVQAGAFPIVFGDFRIGYRIFDRIALSIVRDDLTQRTKGRVRFHGRRRVAGGVRRAEALRKLKIAAS